MLSFLAHHWPLALSTIVGTGGLGALAIFCPAAFGIMWEFVKPFFDWLAKDLWRITTLLSCICIVILHFQKLDALHDSAKWQAQSVNYRRQLDQISSAKNSQKVITQDRIVTVTKTIKEADKRAQKVENAPLPGGCHSPKAVLDADL